MTSQAVLIVEDDANLREALLDTLGDGDHPVFAAGSGPEALNILKNEDIGLVVSDLQMEPMDGTELLGKIREQHPALPAVLMTAYGTIESAVDVMRKGAVDFLVKPFDVEDLKAIVDRHLKERPEVGQPVAADPKTVELLRVAQRVARSNATITLSGESGCGKEVIARYIHGCSNRADGPFIAINCAAIPENMLEAVLFGYEKGAFTGASAAHPGKFEQAQGGTLLLDEISEMDLGLQAKLLRVIQEKEVERIGGRSVIALDVRVLATTNRDLRQNVADGKFREDLYYRLNVFPLTIPPLRVRKGDILPLAQLAVNKHSPAERSPATISAGAERRLLAYDWPGNVRELENVIQRTLIMLQGKEITAADLVLEGDECHQVVATDVSSGLQDELKAREYQLIVDSLNSANGNRVAVAKSLGISPRTLRYKLARMREDGFITAQMHVGAASHSEGRH
jgi:two-component system response regulator FlrC